jgi:two-component system, OmpR family, sensor histidine kinase KdpD
VRPETDGSDGGEHLKVFLGYASGVGKSVRMFDEARRRRERGQDVVVGITQPTRSPEVESLLPSLEMIPPRTVDGVGTIDVDRILRRRPQVCIIDGLAYDNPPGCSHAHRWQDVEELLAAGIVVITSVNLHHIEEEREKVEQITGKHVTATIPKRFLNAADEIVVVDVPPELLLSRAGEAHADPEAARRFSELREIALLVTADIVDHQLDDYLTGRGIDQSWGTQERLMVCITPRANARRMISSAARGAARFHGDLFVVYVAQPDLGDRDRALLDQGLTIAREAGARIETLDDEDPVGAIARFAHEHRVTQLFVGHSMRGGWWQRFAGGPLDRLIRAADGMDVHVFPH